MQDQDYTFDQWQFFGEEGVEEHTHHGYRDHDEGAMKWSVLIAVIIECKQADEHVGEGVPASGDARVPA